MRSLPNIPPVFVVGTGRCGSTMISNVLNRHPDILSLSEFFGFLELKWRIWQQRSGEQMWNFYGRHSKRTRLMVREQYPELLYPFADSASRYTRQNVPPLLCATLPHITEHHEELFAELEAVVKAQPGQAPARHFRYLFEWLCQRFERRVWVERSGSSLLLVPVLIREFPDARFIHIIRDGRETAISMSRHYLFRTVLANVMLLRGVGVDPLRMMSNQRRWEWLGPRLEILANRFIRSAWLPYDQARLPDYAAFWQVQIDMTRRFFANFPAERLLTVRFEDVLDAPEAQLHRLIRFIDPSLENETWLAEASRVPRQTRSKFNELGEDDKAAITSACRAGLEHLGYD